MQIDSLIVKDKHAAHHCISYRSYHMEHVGRLMRIREREREREREGGGGGG